MYEPRHLDLFSGIGGFSIAAERCGFRTIGFSEIDPYASAVLRKHWPGVPNFGTIRNICSERTPYADLITGGFPCQPFSVAGKRGGDSDERFLWPEIVRVMRQLRPRFALFENVPGLLTIDGGRTFNRILSDLSSLRYCCSWNCVPASAVGANHQRDRVWIVASEVSDAADLCGKEKLGNESERVLQTVSNSDSSGCIEQRSQESTGAKLEAFECGGWWQSEPNVGRVAHGVSKRVDRLRCLGNAIVPQVAEIFIKEIRKHL